MSDAYLDHRLNFPTTGIALALEGLDALRAELGFDVSAMPNYALGDPRDANGDVVVPQARAIDDPPDTSVVWVGRPGMAASSYTDLNGDVVEVPAKGAPDRYYIHIRATGGQDPVTFNPAEYGMSPSDPAESADVLGIWAGDAVPVASTSRARRRHP